MSPQSRDRFLNRAQRASKTILAAQDHLGGWGLTLTSVSSIVNTAEALHLFRVAGVPCTQQIMRGMAFISENVREHTELRQNGGRGRNTRFPVFALYGLAQYAPGFSEPASLDTLEWCLDWLSHNKARHGWPELAVGGRTADQVDTSIQQTANALHALALVYGRINEMAPVVGVGRARSLRDKIEGHAAFAAAGLLRHRRPDHLWPPMTYSNTAASPAKTALSLLAFRSMQDNHLTHVLPREQRADLDEMLYASAARLAADHQRWETYVESDPEVPGTDWKHFSFAMCLAAACRSGVSPGLKPLAAAWRQVDRCWSDDLQMWVEPHGGPATIRLAFHVARAYDAIREAPREVSPLAATSVLNFTTAIGADGDLVVSVDDQRFVITLSSRLRDLAEAVVRSHDGLSSRNIADRMGLAQGSVAQYVARINRSISRQTDELVTQFIVMDALTDHYRLASG